jgi:hypothetical protein
MCEQIRCETALNSPFQGGHGTPVTLPRRRGLELTRQYRCYLNVTICMTQGPDELNDAVAL